MSSSAKRPLQVRDLLTGRLYYLDGSTPLASGGEAYIYTVQSEPALVAKLYKPRNDDKPADFAERLSDAAAKVAVMLANPPVNPTAAQAHPSYAWPTAMISQPSNNTVIGFLMPRITGMKEIFEFYNPGKRREVCPSFDYQYLIQTARNLAGIMHEAHSKGYVVGDVNQKNILVSDRALVTLIDTDSFQVRDPQTGRLYLCGVGSLDFMAPELGKKKSYKVERTIEQDLFGLAVLVFHLLMEGVHPFSGVEPGSADPKTPQQRVASGEFTYAPGSRVKPMVTALPFETLHSVLRALFIQCFVSGHSDPRTRPSARDWQKALDKAAQELRSCNVNEKHLYGAHLGEACPWCAKVARGLNDPFPRRAPIRAQPIIKPPAKPVKKGLSWQKVIMFAVIIIAIIHLLRGC